MLVFIKWIINLIFGDIIYLISYFIPKENNLWIFGSWFGEKYNDNSKYLFEYVNKNHPEIRAVWLTKNDNTFKIVKEKGFEVCKMNTLTAHLLSLRAGICVITQSVSSDLNLFVGKKTKIIQLWHGTPLKKIYYDAHNVSWMGKLLMIFFPHLKENYSILIAPSKKVKDIFSTAFNINENKIKITGYPRNDGLLDNKNSISNSFKGIYLPTFRDNSEFNLFEYNFNLSKVEKSLKKLNTDLCIQLHPQDNLNIAQLNQISKNSDHIHYITFEDLYSNLKYFDFLITDYSSIFFDYLLLEKPIIFAPFDFETYTKKDREIYYDYRKVTPGSIAKDWNDIICLIEETKNNPNKHLDDIQKIKNVFNKYSDRNSCQRVFKEIKRITLL